MTASRLPPAVLDEVRELLNLFGVANDAHDHGSIEEAGRLRSRARAGLRAALAAHPSLLEMVPSLPRMLDGDALTYSWPTVLNAIEQGAATGDAARD